MAGEPSGRFKNWTGVTFTPTGGVAIPITGVTNIDIAWRTQVISASGDADYGPSQKNVVSEDPQFTIELDRLAVTTMLSIDLRGTFHAIHNDADNEDGSGAMEYTVVNARITDLPRGGRHRAYGTGRIVIETMRPDGRTNPVSISLVA